VIARELLGTAQVPGGEELKLFAHGRDFMIVLGHNELMSTRMRGSEEALATMTLDRLGGAARDARLLVGGYGMGFTLRAALARLGPKGHVTVAELVPEIIEWAKGPMAEVAAGCLDDPRVTLRMDDVADAMLLAPEPYDAILLDVDNGPDGLTHPDNDRLYARKGLIAAREALRPGGVLAVWSAAPDHAFKNRLIKANFEVEESVVRTNGERRGARHVIWIAKRPS
jgi:spermidine synthase